MSAGRVRFRQGSVEATAAGIYGLIITNAVIVAAHAKSTAALVVTVGVTLTVYWAAERYARILAERLHMGRRLTRAELRHHLVAGWEIVSMTPVPVAVLGFARIAGLDQQGAQLAALIAGTVLLTAAGWQIGGRGRLSTGERLAATAVAAGFGAVMVLLKSLLH